MRISDYISGAVLILLMVQNSVRFAHRQENRRDNRHRVLLWGVGAAVLTLLLVANLMLGLPLLCWIYYSTMVALVLLTGIQEWYLRKNE